MRDNPHNRPRLGQNRNPTDGYMGAHSCNLQFATNRSYPIRVAGRAEVHAPTITLTLILYTTPTPTPNNAFRQLHRGWLHRAPPFSLISQPRRHHSTNRNVSINVMPYAAIRGSDYGLGSKVVCLGSVLYVSRLISALPVIRVTNKYSSCKGYKEAPPGLMLYTILPPGRGYPCVGEATVVCMHNSHSSLRA